ncbi:MAG: type II toxin-antitoxin system VapC family toxin [Candidatus Thorarchaeota archaeon]|nr:type II toxin-antitoxin system VapC family toxin [Candidatus Thorarchaeota archaeon]
MTFACFDTSFLIDFLRGEEETRKIYRGLKSKDYNLATTVVNVFELFRGVDKHGKIKSEEDAVRELASRLIVWDLTIDAAERASRIYTDRERTGTIIGLNDCFTAAIAASNGCQRIVSLDALFDRIPGIENIPY